MYKFSAIKVHLRGCFKIRPFLKKNFLYIFKKVNFTYMHIHIHMIPFLLFYYGESCSRTVQKISTQMIIFLVPRLDKDGPCLVGSTKPPTTGISSGKDQILGGIFLEIF